MFVHPFGTFTNKPSSYAARKHGLSLLCARQLHSHHCRFFISTERYSRKLAFPSAMQSRQRQAPHIIDKHLEVVTVFFYVHV